MFEEKLRKAIQQYLDAQPANKSARKGAITKLINSSPDVTRDAIQKVIAQFEDLPKEIKNRFTPNSLYREGSLVFGWFRENQMQAEAIPVDIAPYGLDREGYLEVLADRDGFVPSIPLPLRGGCTVDVPPQKAFLYAKYGWANACPIQWHRDAEAYTVDRSIIPHGFWQAWKWWEGAWYWYLERRPELFEDVGGLWREKTNLSRASRPLRRCFGRQK